MTVLTVFNSLTNAYMQYVEHRDSPTLTADERLAFDLISRRYIDIRQPLEQYMSLDLVFKLLEYMPNVFRFLSFQSTEAPFDRIQMLLNQEDFHKRHNIPKPLVDKHEGDKIIAGELPNMKKNSKTVQRIKTASANMVRLYRIIHDTYPELQYGFDEQSFNWPGFRSSIDPRTVA